MKWQYLNSGAGWCEMRGDAVRTETGGWSLLWAELQEQSPVPSPVSCRRHLRHSHRRWPRTESHCKKSGSWCKAWIILDVKQHKHWVLWRSTRYCGDQGEVFSSLVKILRHMSQPEYRDLHFSYLVIMIRNGNIGFAESPHWLSARWAVSATFSVSWFCVRSRRNAVSG